MNVTYSLQLAAGSLVSNEPKMNRRSHRLRDFSLYILIAVAVVGLAGLLGVHAAKTGQQPEVAFKSVGFTVNVVFVLGSLLTAVRPLLKYAKLWAVLAGLLLLHGTIGALVISRVSVYPLDLVRTD